MIELIETTMETKRIIPLKNVLRIVWTVGVSVRSACISTVQIVEIPINVKNTNVSNAPVTANRCASSKTHRLRSNPVDRFGTGNQSRHWLTFPLMLMRRFRERDHVGDLRVIEFPYLNRQSTVRKPCGCTISSSAILRTDAWVPDRNSQSRFEGCVLPSFETRQHNLLRVCIAIYRI